MSLFTSPVTLNDGTSDHIFNLRNQLNGLKAKQFGSEWIESAAAASVASLITVKHDESSATINRRLLQYKYMATIADATTLKPITVNFTTVGHKEHTDAQMAVATGVIIAALAASGFEASFNEGQL